MSNYPLGAREDVNAPYNQPLTVKVEVDVDVELTGTIIAEVEQDQEIDTEHLSEIVTNKLQQMYNNQDFSVNNVNIWGWKRL